MWKRFVRAMKALFGAAVSSIEDPKLILEQNIRDLNDQVPKMNENITTVKANVTLLEKEMNRLKNEYQDLVSKMKAAIQASRDDIAANYAMRLETVKNNLATTQQQHASAQKAYEKALEIKKAFLREKDKKISEAKEALRAHERAKWQAKVADTLEQFEVAGMDQTHDEMLQRINEQTAKNEARMDIALESIDTTGMKLEEEAEKIRAQDLVNKFKQEMGMFDTPKTRVEDDLSNDAEKLKN